jgi:uncharacterized protein YgiM (DUF1202 family)
MDRAPVLNRVAAVTALVMMTCSGVAAAQVVPSEGIDFGRYHALVIGNNDYEHLPKLKTAVNDAEATAALLRDRYGFEVRLLVDATRDQIIEGLNRFRRELTERDNLLIYYAGHGVLDEATETGFWLPVDARDDSETRWIANETLTRNLRAMSAGHVLVVADSCYSGTLVRSAPAALATGAERRAWLERMSRLRSRTALLSGGLEPVLDAGGGDHSVFAKAFLTSLRVNAEVLEAQELFARVSRPVVLNARQTPRYSDIRQAGHDGGDFLFVPVSTPPATVATPGAGPILAPTRDAIDLAFWRSVEASGGASDLEAYLRRFPDGNFAALARNRLRALSAPPPVEVEPMDTEFVALRNANVRAAPTTAGERLGTLRAESTVTVTGKVKGANWYRIARAGGASGYVFAPLLGEAPLPAPPTPAVDAAELALWNAVRNRDNPADLHVYLQKYPEGLFAAPARLRLDALAEATQAAQAKRAAEARRQTEAQRLAEERTRLAAAEAAAPRHRDQFPHDGRYEGRLITTWMETMTLGGQCREGDLKVEIRDGQVSGGINIDYISDKALERTGFRLQIEGRVNQQGKAEAVKAQVYLAGLNFMTYRFQGTVTKGTWVDVMKQCRGEYRLARVGD